MILAMIAVSHIADVLGGQPVLRRRLGSLAALDDAVAEGLPKAALRQTASRIFAGIIEQKRLMNRIVPEATFKRRRDRLSAAESERTERIARVVANAEYVWDDRENARRFLTTPHPALGGRSPIDAAMTELGARRVEEILGKIFHGLPA
jgi:putative toxin-antitoxin system antitoxin component (TIGR02293 family)